MGSVLSRLFFMSFCRGKWGDGELSVFNRDTMAHTIRSANKI